MCISVSVIDAGIYFSPNGVDIKNVNLLPSTEANISLSNAVSTGGNLPESRFIKPSNICFATLNAISFLY